MAASPVLRYIDAHNHIYCDEFNEDISQVIEHAQKIGLIGSVIVAEYLSDFEKIIRFSERFPGFCYPCLGLHPVQGMPHPKITVKEGKTSWT